MRFVYNIHIIRIDRPTATSGDERGHSRPATSANPRKQQIQPSTRPSSNTTKRKIDNSILNCGQQARSKGKLEIQEKGIELNHAQWKYNNLLPSHIVPSEVRPLPGIFATRPSGYRPDRFRTGISILLRQQFGKITNANLAHAKGRRDLVGTVVRHRAT